MVGRFKRLIDHFVTYLINKYRKTTGSFNFHTGIIFNQFKFSKPINALCNLFRSFQDKLKAPRNSLQYKDQGKKKGKKHLRLTI